MMQGRKANGSCDKRQAGKHQCVEKKQHTNHRVACKMQRKLLRIEVSASSGTRKFSTKHPGDVGRRHPMHWQAGACQNRQKNA